MDDNIQFAHAEQLFRRLANGPCVCEHGCDGKSGIYRCKLEIVRRWIRDVDRSQRYSQTYSGQAREANNG